MRLQSIILHGFVVIILVQFISSKKDYNDNHNQETLANMRIRR